jgi:hypothetical protein
MEEIKENIITYDQLPDAAEQFNVDEILIHLSKKW